ncbi:MAG: platelet-activating factor acetylhydrolase IB subunit [Planctomycetota bacterium]
MIRPAPTSVALAIALAAALPSQQDRQPQDNPAVVPAERDGNHRARHERINAEVQAHQGACDLIFVGDSITQGWEGKGKEVWAERYGARRALNLGIGGDRTEHVLWRFAHGNLDGIAPKVAVVMIGTNNLGHGSSNAEQTLAGVQRIVAELRARTPTTRVLLLGIFPRGERFNAMRGDILQINQALRRLHDGEHVHFLDIGHVFVEDDGAITPEIMPDALHLSPAGYRRWAEAMEPTLQRLLAD